jgi:hypothetical protein
VDLHTGLFIPKKHDFRLSRAVVTVERQICVTTTVSSLRARLLIFLGQLDALHTQNIVKLVIAVIQIFGFQCIFMPARNLMQANNLHASEKLKNVT